MRPLNRLSCCGLVAALALASTVGCTTRQAIYSDHQPCSVTAPSQIQILDLDGQPFDLWQHQDRVVVAVFTRSDCPISNRFAPEIRQMCATYQPRGVDFYLVYVDPLEEPEAIRRHLQEFDYPCPGLRDPQHQLVAHCQATITPEAVVFNRHQQIAYLGRVNNLYSELGSARPEPTTHDLADAIEAALAGKAVPNPRTKAIGCPIADLAN